MKHYLLLTITLLGIASMGLTPDERKVALKARSELRAGHEQYQAAAQRATEADQRAAQAEAHAQMADDQAAKTAQAAGVLQTQVDAAAAREGKLVTEVNSLRDLKKQVYSHWGLGGILLGFSILVKHIFITVIVIAVVAVALFALSFFFPIIGVGLKIVWAFIKREFSTLIALLKRIKLFKITST
jgi:hypothetical protein